jgi:hypothetical protein
MIPGQDILVGSDMTYFQYIRVRPSIIPQEVWDNHRFNIPIAGNGYVYLGIRRGMYSPKEAGVLAFNQPVQNWHLLDTNPCPSLQVFGATVQNALRLPSVLMTSE